MKGSLRAHLFAGAFVWMIAVFVAVTALLLKIARSHPEYPLPGPTYHAALVLFFVAFAVGGLLLIQRSVAPLMRLRANLSSLREGPAAGVG